MPLARIYILRHGETAENRAHIIQGQLDTVLNDAGRAQAAMGIDVFRNINLGFAFTSDLQRAAETTDIILRNHPNRENINVVKEKELRERGLGRLEGQSLTAKRAQGPDETAESVKNFVERGLAWWDRQIVEGVTSIPGEKPHEVLVVSHGGFISTLVKNLVSSGRVTAEEKIEDWTVFNVSITRIEVEGKQGKLIKYSDISHLGRAEDLVHYNADAIKIVS